MKPPRRGLDYRQCLEYRHRPDTQYGVSPNAAPRTEPIKEPYQWQIEATDQQIDALACELYGLTEKEIAVVDGRNH